MRPELDLKPCPSCGKAAGELRRLVATRFPWYMHCRACGFATAPVRLEGVAVRVWNIAKVARARQD